jgi:hypothetical protein
MVGITNKMDEMQKKQEFITLLSDEYFRSAIVHYLMDDVKCRSIVVEAISSKVYDASNGRREAYYWRKFLSVSLFLIALFAKDLIQWILERVQK